MPVTRNPGDVVAQSVARRTQDPKTEVRTPSGAQEKLVRVFQVKNVLLARRRCAQPPCVYVLTHKNDHVPTLKIL